MEPIDEQIDHIRGPAGGRVITEYGDYEYQDCKHAGAGQALCSGVKNQAGVVDLIQEPSAGHSGSRSTTRVSQ